MLVKREMPQSHDRGGRAAAWSFGTLVLFFWEAASIRHPVESSQERCAEFLRWEASRAGRTFLCYLGFSHLQG